MLYGLVEYYGASGDAAALQDAVDLYHKVMDRAHDAANGGWGEHFEPDWRPIVQSETVATGTTSRVSGRPSMSRPMVDPQITNGIGVAGTKSAEAHLQWMAALIELYRISREGSAPSAAAEVKV